MKELIGVMCLIFMLVNISYSKDTDKTSKIKSISQSPQTTTVSNKDEKVNKMRDNKKLINEDVKNVYIDSDENDSGVFIDESFEYRVGERYDDEKKDVDSGIILPYSFGVLKGTLNMEGKGILVFESDEAIYFVIVYKEKESIKWKLYGKLIKG